MKDKKIIHQLFVGMVSDEIGIEMTQKLLKEAHDSFPEIPIETNKGKAVEEEIRKHLLKDGLNEIDPAYLAGAKFGAEWQCLQSNQKIKELEEALTEAHDFLINEVSAIRNYYEHPAQVKFAELKAKLKALSSLNK